MKYLARYFAYEKRLAKAVTSANKRCLRACGAYVRKIARDFVKHRSDPNKASEPLHSPYDHFGLKKSIIFGADEHAAYIGPKLIRDGLSNVARLHEFGGVARVRDIDPHLWNGVEVGDEAPVVETRKRKSDPVLRHDTRSDPKTGKKVVWIKIANKSQAEHSTRLYRRMAKAENAWKQVSYSPRPYMAPALSKALPHLPAVWKNSIKE